MKYVWWQQLNHIRRLGLVFALLVVTAALAISFLITILSNQKSAKAAVAPFGQSSFWNSTVPAYTDLHPNSAQLVANIVAQSTAATLSTDRGATFYESSDNTSLSAVTPYDCGQGVVSGLAEQWSAVPIPIYAVSGGSAGQRMIVYQPTSSTIWEFAGMRNVGGQWQACSGGRSTIISGGVLPNPFGVMSSGLALIGGQIQASEIKSGQINHVVGLSLPSTNGISWPASRQGGSVTGAPAIGQRLRLDPSLNIDSLGLSQSAKAIAKAAQNYGIIVWDNGTPGFIAESPNSSTSRGLPDPYAGINMSLSGFPWDKLQVLPDNYGQSNGVPSITSFNVSTNKITSGNKVSLSWKSNNVSRCAINGVGDNLVATGQTESKPLQSTTIFVLRCGGPYGVTTAQLRVEVTPRLANDPLPTLAEGVLVDQPYAGYANIFPELISLDGVYKVIYYLDKDYISESTTPPFALNTLRLKNGKYSIFAKVFKNNGEVSDRKANIKVDNKPEVLGSVTQSQLLEVPSVVPRFWLIIGLITSVLIITLATLWGRHKIQA